MCDVMVRLSVRKVLYGHIQFLAKIKQPTKCIHKGNVARKQYDHFSDKRSGNQKVMIKVCHTVSFLDVQTEHNQTTG